MIETFYTDIPRLKTTEKRKVYVYCPDDFAQNPDSRYPVLYMFDGHNVFFDADATYGKSWGMLEYLTATQMPLMVVAVDCDHRKNNGRLREYSPYHFSDSQFGSIRGRGHAFMVFLTESLKPMIDAQYPTLPDRAHTFIAGSSMGGLMTLYALSAFSHVFSKGAALSPSVWVNTEGLLCDIRGSEMLDGSLVYMDYGSGELDHHPGMLTGLEKVSHALLSRGAYVTFRIVPGGQHCEACWEEQLPFFMPQFFYRFEN